MITRFGMILTKKSIQYFQSLNSRVLQSIAKYQSKTPFHYDDEIFFAQYECLRSIWKSELSIKKACQKHNISKSSFYEIEKRFIVNGLAGLFPFSNSCQQHPDLEQLTLLIKKARPQISYTSIHRIAQVVPITERISSTKLISKILQSHGYGISDMEDDISFWGKIQRILNRWSTLIENPIGRRCSKNRKTTFMIDADEYHKRIELLRHLFYNPDTVPKQICFRFGISMPTYYRLIADYKFFGIWAVIAAHSPGKQSLSPELQLAIIVEKLKHPEWSPELIIKKHKLKVSRYAVYRVITRWGLNDKSRAPIALDEYLSKEHLSENKSSFKPLKSAFHLQSDSLASSE
jgi:transposase